LPIADLIPIKLPALYLNFSILRECRVGENVPEITRSGFVRVVSWLVPVVAEKHSKRNQGTTGKGKRLPIGNRQSKIGND
jgi:hypothetical protein